ncbi:amino acid adenylation domain-containing protein [Kitasatospora sp. NPDC086791]|uniref:non-ribosomal peptide synthetase n=1 Tax=Kitasatospora sp. NPDC086791 TaxID=3155178 RepID=UPI003430D1CF
MTAPSPAQQGIWVNERLAPLASVHHMPFTVHFDGPLDEAALARACADLVDRHPALCQVVEEEADGTPVVRTGPPAALVIRTVADDALETELRAVCAAPFDLARGPLVRFELLRTAADRATLVVVAHHLVFDGTSTDLLLSDLARCYAHRAGHGEAPPPPPAAAPDRETAPERLARATAYWSGRALPEPEVLLPGLLGTVPAVGPGRSEVFDLDGPLVAELELTAEKSGVTLYELLVAALHTLLLNHGNPRPALALDLGTRTPEQRGTIGAYVNELPFTTQPDPQQPFGAYAREVRTALRDLYPHREVPLARALPGLRPGVALAPVSFTYRRRIAPVAFPRLDSRTDWAVFPGTARGALRIHAVHGPDRLTVQLMHQHEAIRPGDAARLAEHLRALLAAVAAAPDLPLADLAPAGAGPLVGPEASAPTTLPALLRAAVAEHGDRVALVDGARSFTHRELFSAAAGLAQRLVGAGVAGGDVVAVCAERSAEMLVAVLGTSLAGASYLPLDPSYPADRLEFVLADAGARLALVTSRSADRLPGDGRSMLLDDVLDTAPEAGPPLPEADPDDSAYLIYTSGSTGLPKGVSVPHRALAQLLLAFRAELSAGPRDVWLAVTSLSFDISALELFLPLVTGGRVVLADDAQVRDGRALDELIARHAVTTVQATPSGWRMLLDSGLDAPHLDALCGGEQLPLPLAVRLRTRVGTLRNVYGPTETTIWSTCARIPRDPARITVGRPIAGTHALVVGPGNRPLPHGVVGELAIGGAGVAHGYRNRDDLTAARFVDIPGAGRCYLTGDLARIDSTGELECLGRLDDQVKLRGHRMELGEIEARLLEHPAVTAAAVAVHGTADAPGGQTLVAYPVWRPDATPPDQGELRAFLRRLLPEAMIPQVVHPLTELPLTPNGKTDRRALPAPLPAATGEPAGEEDDELAQEVAAIWCEVLGIPSIGLHDDVFELGAHSLSVTQVAARLRSRLGVDVPLDAFFDGPTVAALAAAVEAEILGEEPS